MTIIIIRDKQKGERMNFEKTAKSFDKHFSKKCEKICFTGMPVTIMKGKNLSLFAVLSVGGCIAEARRSDGRFNAEFDDNTKYVTSNVLDVEHHKNEPMLGFLMKAKDVGAVLGGADILFEYNNGIYNEYEPMLLSSMYLFCEKMPVLEVAKGCLSYPERDFAAMVGVEDTLMVSDGKRCAYVKFPDSIAKIVLCHVKERNSIKVCDDRVTEAAIRSLAAGDYLRFGELITIENARCTECGRASKSIFELAVKLHDGLGYGFLESGGIFAIVLNERVNAFVQNMKMEYEAFYGASPDFYITRTENSGINGIIKGL